jgi:hypothetical protein
LWAIGVRRNTRFRLTGRKGIESTPQCTPDGKRVVYVMGRTVYSVPTAPVRSKVRRKMKHRGRVRLGRLPKRLWRLHAGQARHFIKLGPFSRWVALPAMSGVELVRVANGGRKRIVLRACGRGVEAETDAAAEADGASFAAAVRVVHPVFWMNHRPAFLYVLIRGSGAAARLEVGVYDLNRAKTTACRTLDLREKGAGREKRGRRGAGRGQASRGQGSRPTHKGGAPTIREVDKIEAVWRDDDKAVALSLRVRFGGRTSKTGANPIQKLFHWVYFPASGHLRRPPAGYRVARFHGWQERSAAVLFSGRRAKRRPRLYGWKVRDRGRRGGDAKRSVDRHRSGRGHRPRAVVRLSRRRRVVAYNSYLRTALLAVAGRKGCKRQRLLKVKRGRTRSLIRWAVWSQLLATDPSGQWGVFRGASRCHHPRPVLYMMRLDGSKLMRELPKRFRLLRSVDPAQVTICSRQAPP